MVGIEADGTGPAIAGSPAEARKVVLASSLGTMFEWYDFYLYGSLTGLLGAQFFSQFAQADADLLALVAFASGFVVRPVGALVFGRLADLVGRKFTLVVTILLMGLSTFAVGLLPGYATIGVAAPITLIALRLLQGLALGGEYGSASTYVAEHAPPRRRGLFTSAIQVTATAGLLLSLLTILATRAIFGEDAFADWAWRIPFLASVPLLGISIWVRVHLDESPVFRRMKEAGAGARMPLREAFGNWRNGRLVLIALFGLTMGQAVIWYTGQFYALFFLQSVLNVDEFTAGMLTVWSLVLALGFFPLFGALSDLIGRKPVILTGFLLAALALVPVFRGLTAVANPALWAAVQRVEVRVLADPADCGTLFNPLGIRVFTTTCDIARAVLAEHGVTYVTEPAPAGAPARIAAGGREAVVDGGLAAANPQAARAALMERTGGLLQEAGFPAAGHLEIVRMSGPFDLFRPQVLQVIGLLWSLVLLVAIVYAPMAAALVEMFPTRIRCTSMSLPYHAGNGWFGGLLPATVFAINAQAGGLFLGLVFPVATILVCFLVGLICVPETRARDLEAG